MTMDIQKVSVPLLSYTRYSYTSSCAIRIFKRFNVLLNKTDLNGQEEHLPPKYANPTIYIVRSAPGGDYFNDTNIQFGRRQGKVEPLHTPRTVEDIRKDDVHDSIEKILVLVTDRPDEPIEWVQEFASNTLIVSPSEENSSLITQKHAFIREFNVPVVPKVDNDTDGVATAIDALLERVVFRKLFSLVDVLSAFKEVNKGLTIEENVQLKMTDYTQRLFSGGQRSSILQGMFIEVEHFFVEQDKEMLKETTETISEVPDEPAKIATEIPKELASLEGIKERYFEDLRRFYMLVYKVSEDVARKIEQFVHGKYREIPDKIRQLLPLSLDVGSISSVLQPQIINLLAFYIPKELTLDEHKRDSAIKMLIAKVGPNKTAFVEELQKMTTQLDLVKDVDRRINKVKELYDSSFHRLMWEIKGMYTRSKVPKSERPLSENESKILKPEVVKSLFENVSVTIGTGYRCDQLHVYVRENSGTDIEQAKKDIKDVLAKFHISDYRVMTSKETVQHYKSVGARIQVARRGTLGGFAWMNGEKALDGKEAAGASKDLPKFEKQLCALMSKHVVNGSREVYWLKNDQNDKIKIGDILEAADQQVVHSPSTIDVAAAKISLTEICSCDTKFRNSRQEACGCQLFKFTNLSYLQGLPVHFLGASTKLGVGSITAPEYFFRDENEAPVEPFVRYVIVEDIESIEEEAENRCRFCTNGDSGGIICADRPDGEIVDVISMIIGCMNYAEVDRDPQVLGRYMSFRMVDGLAKLQEETQHSFTLCSD